MTSRSRDPAESLMQHWFGSPPQEQGKDETKEAKTPRVGATSRNESASRRKPDGGVTHV